MSLASSAPVLAVALLFLLPLPAARAATPLSPGHEALAAAALQIREILPPEARTASVEAAYNSSAYFSAISLAAGEVSHTLAEQWWAEVQEELEPSEAFLARAAREIEGLSGDVRRAALQLENATSLGLTSTTLDRGMLAAQLIVSAEELQTTAAGFHQNLAELKGTTPAGRSTLVRPIESAILHLLAARLILEGAQPDASSRSIDAQELRHQVDLRGGVPGKFLLPEHGVVHRLLRHASLYSTGGESDPPDPVAQLRTDIEDLKRKESSLLDQNLPSGFVAAARADLEWWLPQVPQELNDNWKLLLKELHKVGREALYSSDVVVATVNPDAGPVPSLGPLAVVGAVGGVLALLFRGRRARGRTVSTLLAAGFVASLLIPAAWAEALPADPATVPVAFTEASGVAAVGNLARTPDGAIHFVWNEERAGSHFILRYRSYDPATKQWSAITTLRDAPTNSSSPRIYANGSNLQVMWIDDYHPKADAPSALMSCRLQSGACQSPQVVSGANAQVIVHAGALDDQGRLRAAWHQKLTSDTDAIYYREQTATGWGPVVGFVTGSMSQLYPSVAIDPDRKGHVAWYERRPGTTDARHRIVYASVAPGAAAGSPIEEVTHTNWTNVPTTAILAEAGTVHVLYAAPLNDQVPQTRMKMFYRTRTGGTWSAPELINPGPLPGSPNWPTLQREGTTLHAFWAISDPDLSFVYQGTQRVDGFWLGQQNLTGPGYPTFVPFAIVGPDGTRHLAWTGTGPGISSSQMHYRLLVKGAGPPPQPPRIMTVEPSPGGWLRAQSANLVARIAVDRPVDPDATTWKVDGSNLAFQILPDRLVATTPALSEGSHEALLHVVDETAAATDYRWSFHVDRTKPAVQSTLIDGVAQNVTGWRNRPLNISATAAPDNGAPVHLELQVDGRDWSRLASTGYKPPEGRLYDVWLRAVDAAGNVGLGPRFKIGWDATAPSVQATPPNPWSGGLLRVVYAGNASNAPFSGSPAFVEAIVAGETFTRNATALMESGVVEVSALVAGTYSVSLVPRDEAGNSGPASGPWQVRVDTTPPTISFQTTDDGKIRIVAEDIESGIKRMEARLDPVRTLEGVGENRLEMIVEHSAGSLRARAFNMAGLGVERTLSADGKVADPSAIPGLTETVAPSPNSTISSAVPSSSSGAAQSEPVPGLTGIWLIPSIYIMFIWTRVKIAHRFKK